MAYCGAQGRHAARTEGCCRGQADRTAGGMSAVGVRRPWQHMEVALPVAGAAQVGLECGRVQRAFGQAVQRTAALGEIQVATPGIDERGEHAAGTRTVDRRAQVAWRMPAVAVAEADVEVVLADAAR